MMGFSSLGGVVMGGLGSDGSSEGPESLVIQWIESTQITISKKVKTAKIKPQSIFMGEG